MKRRIALLMSVIVFFGILSPSLLHASSITNETEFYNYLVSENIVTVTDGGHSANYTTYKNYNLIVYGYPNDIANNRTKYNSTTKTYEPEYLGFDVNDNKFTNPNFPPDKLSGNPPWEWNYIPVNKADETWKNIPKGQYNHMMYSTLYNPSHGVTKEQTPTWFNVQYIGGINYAKIQSPATWGSEGSIFTMNQGASGKIYYADFKVDPMIKGPAVSGGLTTSQNTYTIKADQTEINIPITVNANANLSGNATKDQVLQLKAGYKSQSNAVNKQTTVSLNTEQKLTRSQYKPGTYQVPLEGYVSINSIFGDSETKVVSKTITLIVEDDGTSSDNALTAIIYTAKSMIPPNEDIGYEDRSIPPKNGKITQRQLIVTDEKGNQIYSFTNQIEADIEFSNTGTYTLTLVVMDNFGNIDSDTKIITVEENTAVVNAVLDISVAPDYETLYYTQEQIEMDKQTEIWVHWNAEDSTSTNGVGLYRWYKEGEYKGTSKEGTYSEKIAFSPSNPSVSGSVKVYDSITNDRGIASDALTIKFEEAPKPEAQIKYNSIAVIDHEITVENTSFIPRRDKSNIKVTKWGIYPQTGFIGSLTGDINTLTFTEEGEYIIDLYIEDDLGQSDFTEAFIRVIPDKPTPIVVTSGNLKQNREVIFDASYSNPLISPIDFTKTKWVFTPLEGQDPNSIKIKESTDLSNRHVMFKEPGKYLVQAQIENEIGNTSDWYDIYLEIQPDAPPVANFSMITKTTRDPNNNNIAKISIKDMSYTIDKDLIAHRVWEYRYDSNNDGNFEDEISVVFSSGNEINPQFQANNVGKYLITLTIYEQFAESTIPQFIVPDEDYRHSNTQSKAIEESVINVINTKPYVEWGSY